MIKTRAVTRQHSLPELVPAQHEHKVSKNVILTSRLISKMMLLPCSSLGITYHPGNLNYQPAACDLDLEVSERDGLVLSKTLEQQLTDFYVSTVSIHTLRKHCVIRKL